MPPTTKQTFGLALMALALPAMTRSAEPVFEAGTKATQVVTKGAGEGPAWHPELGLFFSGDNRITRLDAEGRVHEFRNPSGSNGLLFDHEGRLLVCEPGQRRVTRTDLKTGQQEVLTARFEGQRYNQPNDITIDSQGRIYFSDPRYGSREGMEILDTAGRPVEGVYRIDPHGAVTRVIAHEADRPNGVEVSGDDQFLYVADNNNNRQGGARKLWRFELDREGNVFPASRKLIYDWGTGRGPDGLVQDQKGRLYVAGGRNEPTEFETVGERRGGVYVLTPDGELLDFVPIPHDEVTNCTFGGVDLKTLYITAGGTLWTIRTTTPGRLAWPRGTADR